jgi:hypothetical protein
MPPCTAINASDGILHHRHCFVHTAKPQAPVHLPVGMRTLLLMSLLLA